VYDSGGNEFDHGSMGHDGEKSMQRFDSSNSMRPDRERRRGFGSDDDSDPFGPFGSSGPFGGGPPAAKQTNVWSAF
jgi:epidermal growth factor receptor substrate 15